jgi:Na+-transporting NADH:ubiquinone oxidoreductase subunit A
MRFNIRKGLDIPLDGEPAQEIDAAPPVSTVGLVAEDLRIGRVALRVEPGEPVALGQTLFVERARPHIAHTSPASGHVVAIERGARRALEAIVIEVSGDRAIEFDRRDLGALAGLERERVVQVLLQSGLWPALRARPFGRVPDPEPEPRSIFVTAIDTEPLAPAAERVIDASPEAFALGLGALTRLTGGPVYVCQAPGAPLPGTDAERVEVAEFDGPHPAGLAGTHIHHLDPVGPERSVWCIGYADVIAIGTLFETGRLPSERVVALTGSCVRRPRLVRTRPGASTEQLLDAELEAGACRVLSGSVLSGRRAVGVSAFLGRFHRQVCAIPEAAGARRRGLERWLAPRWIGRGTSLLPWLPGARRRSDPAASDGPTRAFFPLDLFDRVMPLDVAVAPLLRALLIGDFDEAVELGALELEEEDLALASFVCPARIDYGPLLRSALNAVQEQA